MRTPTKTQRLATRRQRNQELGRIDKANRCAICQIELPVNVFIQWGDPKRYCSSACLDQATSGERAPGADDES